MCSSVVEPLMAMPCSIRAVPVASSAPLPPAADLQGRIDFLGAMRSNPRDRAPNVAPRQRNVFRKRRPNSSIARCTDWLLQLVSRRSRGTSEQIADRQATPTVFAVLVKNCARPTPPDRQSQVTSLPFGLCSHTNGLFMPTAKSMHASPTDKEQKNEMPELRRCGENTSPVLLLLPGMFRRDNPQHQLEDVE
ncbi:hypothetical protein HNQ71_005511 [Mesorhizobium sangaii]|uniref:Uncharacterized protein n=1 Tax=Mesorhizobium sangaii TaxID=505389 RepID=A0A841PRP4_9HYPH|nr:hypothetical protein [Mesorhizobium sangaii]